MTLRELVAAWGAQSERCEQAYAAARDGINRELDAVGGYATTSPVAGAEHLCRTFSRMDNGFGGGVERVGDGPIGGKHADKRAPHHPEVGDRCYELEQAWRREAAAVSGATDAIRKYVASRGGGADNVVQAAEVLVRDEQDERAAVVRFLRGESTGNAFLEGALMVSRLADAIERGDHVNRES